VAALAAVFALFGIGFSTDAALATCTSSRSLSGDTATMTCDGASDSFTFEESGGLLRHNRSTAGDPGFNSDFDFDSGTAGNQTLGASNGNSVNLTTGGGNDTVTVGTNAAPASVLNVTINITNSGSNGDSVLIDDSGSGVGRTITMTSTQVTGLGTTVVSLFGVAYDGGVALRTGSGSDTINVTGVRASPGVQPITATLTNGDTFNIAPAGGSLNQFAQSITATAPGSTGAVVTIDDSATPTNNTYAYTGSQVTRALPSGVFTLNYANVRAPSLTAGTGNDTINITGALGGGSPTINGGGGDDTFNVAPAIGSLDGFGASLNFVGGAGTNDVLTLDDSADTDANTYTIFNSSVSRPGFLGASFDATVESVNLLGGTASNVYNLNATAPISQVNITGGGAGDSLVFANGGTLNGGFFDGGGGANSLDYTLYATAVTVNLGTATATATGDIANVQNILGGSGNDSLTGSAAVNDIKGGPGNDTITGGPGDDVLDGGADDDIFLWNDGDGSDTVTGGTGSDAIQVTGSSGGVGDIFTVSSSGANMHVSRSNLTPFTLDLGTMERLVMNGGNGGDSFTLLSSNAGFDITFNGNDGDDAFLLDSNGSTAGGTVKTIHGPLTISGGTGVNTLTINDTDSTFNTAVTVSENQVDAASGDNLFPAGVDLTYQNIGTLFLTTGSGDDTVTAIPSATTIYTFFGGAQPTNDTIVVTLAGVANPVTSGDASFGQITSDNRQPVTFRQFETLKTDATAPLPTISINDVTVTEGNSGTTTARFTVSLSAASTETVGVLAVLKGDTASLGSDVRLFVDSFDFNAVIFQPGQTIQRVDVLVNGDTLFERDETFFVDLSRPTPNAVIGKGRGVGTILNDDPRFAITVEQPTITPEPPEGLPLGAFGGGFGTLLYGGFEAHATKSPLADEFPDEPPIRIKYLLEVSPGRFIPVLADGEPGDDAMFARLPLGPPAVLDAVEGSVTLQPGETTKKVFFALPVDFVGTVTVTIIDVDGVAVAPGTGTTANNTVRAGEFTPALSIADASVAEGNSGTVQANFAVTLNPASSQVVTVQFATSNGTAQVGQDYQATSGTLTFQPGDTSKTISVPVIGDTQFEGNELFLMTISNPTGGAVLKRTQALGTIQDDEPTAPCGPRPRVVQTVTPSGNTLRVHLTTSSLNGGGSNSLSQIRFGSFQNATVIVNGQAVTSGQTIILPATAQTFDFTVARATAGQAVHVPFTVVDGCGDFPGFVGGGTGAGF